MKDYNDLFKQLKIYKDNEEYLNNFIELIKSILYERTSFVKNSDNNQLREEFFDKLKDIFKDIFKDKNMSDNIEYLSSGHTALAFKIGDNVLKIGKTNYTGKQQEFDCLIPILLDKSFKVDNREYYTIQLSPYVDTSNITEDDLYSSYKRLRDLGYIWNDPTPENLGRIISDIETDKFSYKKGDLVIIDLEDLAYVGEVTPDIVLDEIAFSSYNSRTYRYETRYIAEKGKKL